jgi:hypothetical protein
MTARVYILLNVVENTADQVISAVRGSAGVTTVDAIEGSPDVMLVLEARNRKILADLTSRALASVETMTESITVLPSRDCCSISAKEQGRARMKRRSRYEPLKSTQNERNIADGSQTTEPVRGR